jgi:hypothetical protein
VRRGPESRGTRGPGRKPKARRRRRPGRSRGLGGDEIRARVRGAEGGGGEEAEVGGGGVEALLSCCDVVGEVVVEGMALAWPRRGREKGEQGKRNVKRGWGSAPHSRVA